MAQANSTQEGDDMNHWRIRAVHGQTREPIAGVYSELIAGRARMGWSYRADLDLRIIAELNMAGQALNEDQKDAARCLPFFESIRVHDVLWYTTIPAARRVTVVRVTGEYDYDHGINGVYDFGLGYDFRSVRPCEAVATNLDMRGEIIEQKVANWLNAPGSITRAIPRSAVALSKCLDRVTEMVAGWRFGGNPMA